MFVFGLLTLGSYYVPHTVSVDYLETMNKWENIVSAFAFSLLHASAWSFLPLTVLGLSLGWLAQRGRSLLPAVLLHMAYNAVFVASALYVAGHI